jgi:hypothetical protein
MYLNDKKVVLKGEPSGTLLKPLTAITIAVDTAYVVSQQGQRINEGVYMMDNMEANGSEDEAQMELHTMCPVGSLIGFNAVPINALSSNKGTVEITGFTVSQGSVFTATGAPQKQDESGDYWIGQAVKAGSQTYQVQLKVTNGGLNPTPYYVNWDPFITAQ